MALDFLMKSDFGSNLIQILCETGSTEGLRCLAYKKQREAQETHPKAFWEESHVKPSQGVVCDAQLLQHWKCGENS